MNRPIKVLLLDDKAEKMKDFVLEAKSNRVQVVNEITNSIEAINELRKNHDAYEAIILDALFFEKPDSPTVRNAGALSDTLKEIERLLHTENVHLPHCIYTGHFKEVGTDTVVRGKKVFVKGRDQKQMFKYLKNEVEATENFRIKNKFNEIFELFDHGLLPVDKQPDLVNILIKSEKRGKYNDDDAFTPIRKMYEAIIDSLYHETFSVNKKQNVVHIDLFNHEDKLIISWSYHYLSGRDVKINAGRDDEKTIIQSGGKKFGRYMWNQQLIIFSKFQIPTHTIIPKTSTTIHIKASYTLF